MALLFAPAAFAQDAANANGAVAEVVVTGSRITQRAVSSSAPIVTLGADVFAKTAAVTLDDQLNRLPQLAPSAGSSNNDAFAGGATTLSLRGLGANRTLVLLDGRRLPAFDQFGDVDINMVPDALIQSVDIVTGGSSAAYGSDAIAGVVNFKLNHHFNGVQVDAETGESQRGDGFTFKSSATAGGDFADHSGNAVFSLGYATRDGINNSQRSFSAVVRPSSQLPFSNLNQSAANLPSQAAVNAVFGQYGVAAGAVIPNTPFGVNNNGSLFTFGSSALNFQGGAANVLASGGGERYNSSGNNGLIVPLERYSVYSRAERELTSAVTVYGEASYQRYTSTRAFAPAGYTFNAPTTNPFVPSALQTILNSRPSPAADFSVTRRFTDVGFRNGYSTEEEYRFLAGAKGSLGFKDWTYDVYASYAGSSDGEKDTGAFSVSALHTLLYAADGGKSLCAGGLNIFLLNAGASCINYITRNTVQQTASTQQVMEATFQGGLFNLPAGEVRFAAGGDYRRDSFAYTPDSGMASGDVVSFNTGAIPAVSGNIGVAEGYSEIQAPILANLPLIKKFDIDIGYRYSTYNTFGGVSSYRADGIWEIVSDLHLRGGYARAVRAPSIGELYAPQSPDSPVISAPGTIGLGDPCDIRSAYRTGAAAAQVRSLCLAQGVPSNIIDSYTFNSIQLNPGAGVTGGNPKLHPETADTYTLGLAWTPKIDHPLFKTFSVSADAYSITITGAISTIAGLSTLQKCYNIGGFNPTYSASNVYCGLFTRDASNGAINYIQENELNLGAYQTSGVDFAFDWGFGLGAVGLKDNWGGLRISSNFTWLRAFKVQNFVGGPFVDLSGSIGSSTTIADPAYPRWKAVTDFVYTNGPVSFDLTYRYIASMLDSSLIGTGSTASVTPAYNYFDLNVVYNLTRSLTLRGGIDNLGDIQPPTYLSFSQSNTNPGVYDVIGRRYYIGARYRF